MSVIADRAVVMGGGIAGLLAARVLFESYREVLVIDRDQGRLSPIDAGSSLPSKNSRS